MNVQALPEPPLVYLEAIALAVYQVAEERDDSYSPTDEPLYLAYALLAGSVGEAVTAADVHDAWLLWLLSSSNALMARTHPYAVPYEQLPERVQRIDEPYRDAIASLCRIARILQEG